MTRQRISILHENGTVELAEPALYTALNAQDTWDEYGSVAHTMHNNAKQAPQELKDDLSKLRLDIVQAHQGKSTPMPTHDEFVAAVDKYNAWVKTQSLHLDPTTPAPANPPVPKAPVKAPTTTDDTTTPPPDTTTTPVANEERSGTDERLTRLLDRLEGTDGVIERSDAHHVTLYGDGAGNPGLDARVKALENGNVLHSDGTSVSARTVRHESSAEFNYGKILGFALGGLVIGLLLGLLFFLLGAGAFGPIGGAFVGLLFGAIIGIAVGIRERATDTESTTNRT